MLKGWPEYEKYTFTDNVKLISDGNSFFDLLEEIINRAEHTFQLQTYIFENDFTGKKIIKALKDAASRGVRTYILVDSFGTNHLSRKVIKEMKDAGINFRSFSPVMNFRSVSLGRRLHHKIAVADSKEALVGGINIADKYRDTPTHKGWLDFAVYVHGNIAAELDDICNRIWKRSIGNRSRQKHKTRTGRKFLVRVRENDWLRHKSKISRSYRQAFRTANKSIVMVAAYFLPGRQFRNLLRRASARGVDIHIVLAKSSDVKLVHYATRFLYAWMLRNNIKIHEYKNSNVHGKVAVIDKTWSTVGSFNLNYLSIYGSIELNLDILSTGFANDFSKKINSIIESDCDTVIHEDFKKRTYWYNRILYWVSYQLTRISMLIAVYFSTKPVGKNKLKE
ncbi:MAG: phospholipase D-like domain-containing protein [Bacteroidota bacterium]